MILYIDVYIIGLEVIEITIIRFILERVLDAMRINNDLILPDTHPSLRDKCVDIKLPINKEDKELLLSMLEYVHDSHDDTLKEKYNLRAAVGLAAPQVGVNKKMIAICISYEDDEDLTLALVNPKIISHSQQHAYLASGESCLSVVEDVEGYVPRFARITVKGYDMIQEKEITLRLSGYEAIVVQHEIDHLSGILYYDHINKNNPFANIANAIVIE